MRQKTGLSRDDECKISKNSGRKWVRRTTRGALPVEHLGWNARVIDLSGQRVAQEIALESDNPLYKFMDEYLNSFPVGSAAKVPFLFVRPDVETGEATKALMWQEATVVGDTLNTVDGILTFTISLNGDPVEGTVTGLGTEDVKFVPKA